MTLAIFVLSVLPAIGIQDQPPFVVVQGCTTAATVCFQDIKLPVAVTANGKSLAAGVYMVRLTGEHPAPAAGQSVVSECWVDFLRNGAVVAREVASVIGPDEIKDVVKGPAPVRNTARVDVLKERNYVRVWMNSAGTHYLVNLAISR